MNWGERILCREMGPGVVDEVNIERKGSCTLRSAGFWRVQVTSEVREV